MLILITGGAASGKSAFAEQLAEQLAEQPAGANGALGYIATAQAGDEEMTERIRRHRDRRGARWRTFEEPLEPARLIADLAKAAAQTDAPARMVMPSVILLDCLTVLISNLILADARVDWDRPVARHAGPLRDIEAQVNMEIAALARAAAAFPGHCLFVTNEVGAGVTPPSPLGRFFRDQAGAAAQFLAARADAVYLVAAGIPLKLKG